MKKDLVIVGVVCAILGAVVGHVIKNVASPDPTAHMMPDGSMMGGTSTSMHDMMSSYSAELGRKVGEDFDKAFIQDMILHHEGAVQMAELALSNARHEEIKNLGRAIIQAQTTEIAQMKAWQSAWYPQ